LPVQAFVQLPQCLLSPPVVETQVYTGLPTVPVLQTAFNPAPQHCAGAGSPDGVGTQLLPAPLHAVPQVPQLLGSVLRFAQ
jgi:hypothetical protein